MRRITMRYLIVAVLAVLLFPVLAEAQATIQYGQVSCTDPTTGGAPTSVQVQREVTNSGTWTDVGPSTPLPGTMTPYVDTTRVAGTSYRYRCVYANAAGSTPTDPSASFTFLDPVQIPGKGTVNVIIITQPAPTQPGALAPAAKKPAPKPAAPKK
jgi:hypothetical protein